MSIRRITTIFLILAFAFVVVSMSNVSALSSLDYGLFGQGSFLVQFKEDTAEADALPTLHVVPGGHSIGVVLEEQGITVVGHAGVETKKGIKKYPAKDAGVEIGDMILEINNHKIKSDAEIQKNIKENGAKSLYVKVKRGNNVFTVKITPVMDKNLNQYRIGVYIRDSAAGVGTLTFFNPKDNSYGALGHAITDKQWENCLNLGKGKIIEALVQGISAASQGDPGEKIGLFVEKGNISGNIVKNSKYGIFGLLDRQIKNEYFPKAIPLAGADEIRDGPAEILTVLKGDKIERFSVLIEKVFSKGRPDGRGMVIKVLDKELISETGGIIQGMSGSPIIQNGKLVGAVSHVFINDPTRGYGVAAEWMFYETRFEEEEKAS